MGKGDVYVKKMLRDPKRFADLFNASMFQGRQVIRHEDLKLMTEENGIMIMDKKGRKQVWHRRRDVKMRMPSGVVLSVLACEIQERVHYAMPVRTLLYDALDYSEQVQKLEQVHRDRKELVNSEEFLSGIKKKDRLEPVITLVFYYGRKDWDGSRSLYELLDINKEDEAARELMKYVPNYWINLVEAAKEEDLERYQSDLHYVLGMLQLLEKEEREGGWICGRR